MPRISPELIYPELSYKIYGLLYRVHNELGRFKSEKSYGDALELELQKEKVSYVREQSLPLPTDQFSRRNVADFVVDDKIVLELKVKAFITPEDYYQMKRYLDSGKFKLGLIVNFRQKYLRPKRVAN